jgi:hypothetical protein
MLGGTPDGRPGSVVGPPTAPPPLLFHIITLGGTSIYTSIPKRSPEPNGGS